MLRVIKYFFIAILGLAIMTITWSGVLFQLFSITGVLGLCLYIVLGVVGLVFSCSSSVKLLNLAVED